MHGSEQVFLFVCLLFVFLLCHLKHADVDTHKQCITDWYIMPMTIMYQPADSEYILWQEQVASHVSVLSTTLHAIHGDPWSGTGTKTKTKKLLLYHVHHLSIRAYYPLHENKNKESVNSFWYRTDDLIQIECINKQRRERPTIMHTRTHTSSRTAWRLDSFQRWYEVMGCWKTWLCNVRKRVPHRWCSIRKELWPRECSNNKSCIQKPITSTELWKQTRHF